MPDKNRERNTDKEKYKKKQRAKKAIKKIRQAHAISREKRKYVRKQILPHYKAFRECQNKHLLFVLKDTDNMEKILLQKIDIGNGNTLLALPVINEKMINEYLDSINSNEEPNTHSLLNDQNRAINDIINYYYSVTSDEIEDLPGARMICFRNCNITGLKDDLVALNVRPYNVNTWYNDVFTTVNGYKVYQGKNLKTFFKIDNDLGKTFIFQDSLTEILLYKAMRGKIRYNDLLSDYSEMAKRQFLGSGSNSFYAVFATNTQELFDRFKNEEQEDQELDEK